MVMRHLFLIALMLFISQIKTQAQSWGDSSLKNGRVFFAVEEEPKFPGGMREYYKFIGDHLKIPNKQLQHFKKTILVEIIIDKTGKIAYAEIKQGSEMEYNMAVLDMLKEMPQWSPALQNKHPVPVYMTLPILFID